MTFDQEHILIMSLLTELGLMPLSVLGFSSGHPTVTNCFHFMCELKKHTEIQKYFDCVLIMMLFLFLFYLLLLKFVNLFKAIAKK